MGIIYKIENMENGKVYIGQTKQSLDARIKGHIFKANNEEVLPNSLHYDIRNLGIEQFSVEIIAKCSNNKLDDMERYYIDKYKSYETGYNKNRGGGAYRDRQLDKELVIQYLREGLSPTEISAIVDCSLPFISRTISGYNMEPQKYMSSGRLKVIKYTNEWKMLAIYNSILEAYRNTDSKVSESTFSHNIRSACGTGKSLYGYRWALAEDLYYSDGDKELVFRCPIDKKNYLEGKEYREEQGLIVTNIEENFEDKQAGVCKYCGKELGDKEDRICLECAKKHPRSSLSKQLFERLGKGSKEKKITLASKLPDKETLKKLIEEYNYIEICRMYGVYERTLREKLREYGIYKEKINRNVEEKKVIGDVLEVGRKEAAARNKISLWKVDKILESYGIEHWMYSSGVIIKMTNPINGEDKVFKSTKDAARYLYGNDVPYSTINSLSYKIKKAAEANKDYKGYKWKVVDKKLIMNNILSIINEETG